MYLHGTLKKNQGTFCKNETSRSKRAGQKHAPEDGFQCSYYTENEVNKKKKLVFVTEIGMAKQPFCNVVLMSWIIPWA